MKNIILEPDFKLSEERIKTYAEKYNHKLKVAKAKNDTAFIEKKYQNQKRHNSETKESVNSLIIKSSHITTAIAILKAFHGHLKNVNSAGTNPTPFEINNQALATKLSMSKRTSMRHIAKLLAVGILSEKISRKSNRAGYYVTINQSLIAGRKNEELNNLLIQQETELKNAPLTPSERHAIISKTPEFADYPGGVVPNCHHIANTRELNKNNIASGIVDNSNHQKNIRKNLSKTARNNQPENLKTVLNNVFNNQENPSREQPMQQTPDSKGVPQQRTVNKKEKKNNLRARVKKYFRDTTINIDQWTDDMISEIDGYVIITRKFAQKVLYGGRQFTEQEEYFVNQYIWRYFSISVTRSGNEFQKSMPALYNRLQLAFQITKQYVMRDPIRFILPPMMYFDVTRKYALNGALRWVEDIMKKRKTDRNFYKNQLLVGKLYRKFRETPDTHTLLQAQQQLGKLKDKQHLDRFNELVLEKA